MDLEKIRLTSGCYPQLRKREYGFLYRFPETSVLFLRGDFVHAGGCSQPSRAHLKFYPYREAGWTRPNPHQAPHRFEKWAAAKSTYLVLDLRTHPFAYPHIIDIDDARWQIVTYPPNMSEDLLKPTRKVLM